MTLKPEIETKLRNAITHRPEITKKLFEHELTGGPEALIKDGKPFKGNKANILNCISPDKTSNEAFDSKIFDASVM